MASKFPFRYEKVLLDGVIVRLDRGAKPEQRNDSMNWTYMHGASGLCYLFKQIGYDGPWKSCPSNQDGEALARWRQHETLEQAFEHCGIKSNRQMITITLKLTEPGQHTAAPTEQEKLLISWCKLHLLNAPFVFRKAWDAFHNQQWGEKVIQIETVDLAMDVQPIIPPYSQGSQPIKSFTVKLQIKEGKQ